MSVWAASAHGRFMATASPRGRIAAAGRRHPRQRPGTGLPCRPPRWSARSTAGKGLTTDFTDHTDNPLLPFPIRAIRVIRGQKLLPLRQQHHRAVELLRQAGGTAVKGLEPASRAGHVSGHHAFTKKELALPAQAASPLLLSRPRFLSRHRGAMAFAALGRSAGCSWLHLGR